MMGFLRSLFVRKVEPLNKVTINKSNILFNLGYLQGLHPDDSIFPVLKSNAYGHGLLEMLRILDRVHCNYLVVDSLPEYLVVKDNSDKQVLLLGETLANNYRKLDYTRVTPCIWSLSALNVLLQLGKKVHIHLFLNTGMNREGVDSDQLEVFLKTIAEHKNGKNINIEGVLSHFADADEPGLDSVTKQIERFKKMYYTIIDYGHTPLYKHIGNSAGSLKIYDKFFNGWRVGLALYGHNPLEFEDEFYNVGKELRPAMRIQSHVVAVQHLRKGDTVGYGGTWIAAEDCTVITVPFGYTEGMRRSASGKIVIRYGTEMLHQIGRISMNLSTFVVPEGVSIKEGDTVELLAYQRDEFNTVKAWAQAANTIPYEILVGINPSLRREVVL